MESYTPMGKPVISEDKFDLESDHSGASSDEELVEV